MPELLEQRTSLLVELLQQMAIPLWKDWPKNMQAVALDNVGKFSLRGVCPHCQQNSVFMQIGQHFTELDEQTPKGNRFRYVSAMRCQGCLKFILGIVTCYQGLWDYRYEIHYPIGSPDDAVAQEIPQHIQLDFSEALRCRFVAAYNATAEMCRRALEASCMDLGASPKDVLEEMIDELESKRIITPFMKQVAHKIRLGGNRGAHPNPQASAGTVVPQKELGILEPLKPEPIRKITKEHADAIIKFTDEFFHHVYVVPKELEKYDFSKPKP